MKRCSSIFSVDQRAVSVGKLAVIGLALLWGFTLKSAELPQIDFIERFPRYPNDVVIHFAGVPNRTTTLQYLDRPGTNSLITGATSGSWSNLYVAGRYPFPTHYVIPDTVTNSPQRFYRLRVTP
jgi:hypothetical protein